MGSIVGPCTSPALLLRSARSIRIPFRSASRSSKQGARTLAALQAPAQPMEQSGLFKDYKELCEKLQEISTLNGVNGLLMWDEMVMMPPGAAAVRGAQKSALTGVVYDKQTSAELGQLLKKLQGQEQLDEYQAAVVREGLREHIKLTAVPKELEKRRSELESEGYQTWVGARKEKDFSKFAPVLQEWVDLTVQRCGHIDPSRSAYDVALQDYEKGMSTARLDEIFEQLKEGLVPFIKELRERGTPPDATVLNGQFDSKVQAELCNRIAKELGFNLDNGRLDVSVHPFTGGAHPTDVRMTTRFKPDDLTEGLTGAIHETGHALYEQGRNLQFDGLPVNEALSMGVHESQSLLWERMVGLSMPFARYLAPLLQASFPQLPADLSPERVYGAVNVVKFPSMIRVEADEVQYPLHILLRYEVEKALFNGSLAIADVPKAWNQKMEAYLGVTPPDDAQGYLQDMHHSAGAFGYFPTYSLGAMYACQLFKAAQKDLPDLDRDIAAGKFEPLRKWLNEKVHSKGSLYASGDELMIAATGSPLDPSVFLQYLKEKYSSLYRL